MFIACTKNHGIDYLQVHESYSVKENGVTRSRSRLIRNLGPLSRFEDGNPDYLKRLRQSFKDGNPLIESLADLASTRPEPRTITIHFDKDLPDESFSNPENVGYFLLDALYGSLGIHDVLTRYKSESKIQYDVGGLLKLLVFGRVLSPDSKLETWNEMNRYVFDVTSSKSLVEVYRTLDCLHALAESIQKRIHHKIAGSIGRRTEVCFYDVTNYYFETGENDPDVYDNIENIMREGLRKRGASKERRCEPIVQMGLFIDDNGLPIGYELFPGNHIDQTTLRPALKKNILSLELGRVIIVADGGLNSDKNIAFVLQSGNGYILSRSTKRSDKTVKKWILDEEGYEWNEKRTFKVKSMIRERVITDEKGHKMSISEKLVCYWSKKHYEKELRENEKFIDYLNAVIANPDKLKDKAKKIERFLIRQSVNKKTGEVLNANVKLSLNWDKIREHMQLFGYYTLMTSEVDKPDREVIDKYRGLSRIEDSFRITKSDLEGRPVFVRTPEHINAHFLICFIALTLIRVIQYRILHHEGKDTLNLDGWESGLSAERIRKALDSYNADPFPRGYYRLTKPSDDLLSIFNAFGIDPNLPLPTVSELKQFKYKLGQKAAKT